eukprot:gene5945-8194_t
MKSIVRVFNISTLSIDYETIWRYQKALVERKFQAYKSGEKLEDFIILVQHCNIYTLGRGSSEKFIKNRSNMESSIVRVERGGEVTWHGPGQIVLYPILNLQNHKKDLHWYANSLEESVIKLLKNYDIEGVRSPVNTGVWVNNNKISAIGVTASRWITMHGIALNINCDMKYFNNIIPCGITETGYGVCNLQQVVNNINGHVNQIIDINEVGNHWIYSFANVFNMDVIIDDNPLESLNSTLRQYPLIENSSLLK